MAKLCSLLDSLIFLREKSHFQTRLNEYIDFFSLPKYYLSPKWMYKWCLSYPKGEELLILKCEVAVSYGETPTDFKTALLKKEQFSNN